MEKAETIVKRIMEISMESARAKRMVQDNEGVTKAEMGLNTIGVNNLEFNNLNSNDSNELVEEQVMVNELEVMRKKRMSKWNEQQKKHNKRVSKASSDKQFDTLEHLEQDDEAIVADVKDTADTLAKDTNTLEELKDTNTLEGLNSTNTLEDLNSTNTPNDRNVPTNNEVMDSSEMNTPKSEMNTPKSEMNTPESEFSRVNEMEKESAIQNIGSDKSDNTKVELDVGGCLMKCDIGLLEKYPKKRLCVLVKKMGNKVFLDRNAKYFEPVLDFYRTGKMLVADNVNMDAVKEEAMYFGIYAEAFGASLNPVMVKRDVKVVEVGNQTVDVESCSMGTQTILENNKVPMLENNKVPMLEQNKVPMLEKNEMPILEKNEMPMSGEIKFAKRIVQTIEHSSVPTTFLLRQHEQLVIESAKGTGKLLLQVTDVAGKVQVSQAVMFDSNSFFYLNGGRAKISHAPLPGNLIYTFWLEPISEQNNAQGSPHRVLNKDQQFSNAVIEVEFKVVYTFHASDRLDSAKAAVSPPDTIRQDESSLFLSNPKRTALERAQHHSPEKCFENPSPYYKNSSPLGIAARQFEMYDYSLQPPSKEPKQKELSPVQAPYQRTSFRSSSPKQSYARGSRPDAFTTNDYSAKVRDRAEVISREQMRKEIENDKMLWIQSLQREQQDVRRGIKSREGTRNSPVQAPDAPNTSRMPPRKYKLDDMQSHVPEQNKHSPNEKNNIDNNANDRKILNKSEKQTIAYNKSPQNKASTESRFPAIKPITVVRQPRAFQ